jgi:hypothetical protein
MMATKSTTERLALPMFVSGIIAMVVSAGISLGTAANAASPIEYKKVTMTYLSSGYSANDSGCGSAQDLYSANRSNASFRARNLGNSNSDKTFECTATFYMVTNVSIPSPKPVPTVTVIYKPQPSTSPKPSKSPRPYPSASKSPFPGPTASPTPAPHPNWWLRPTPTPTKAPRP